MTVHLFIAVMIAYGIRLHALPKYELPVFNPLITIVRKNTNWHCYS